MVIVGRNWRETPTPAGKMKFSLILIGVMLLRGIELHRHTNRHGHKRCRAGPQIEKEFKVEVNEIDRLNQMDQSMNTQIPVEVTEENKEVRSNREDEIENELKTDGTELAQDSKITPKPGHRNNKLVAKYGTNFRYMGVVKNGIGRVTVVTSIPIPRYENVKVKPIDFAKCAIALGEDDKNKRYIVTADTQASKAAKEWCAQAIPYIEYLKEQEKYYIDKVHELLCDDLYAALPELKLTSGPLRARRGLGALFLSAIPG